MKLVNLMLVIAVMRTCLGADPRPASSPPVSEKTVGGKTVSEWIAMTSDPDAELRSDAAWTLGQIGPTAKGAVPVLTGLLADKNSKVRECAAYALGRIGPDAKTAVPALIESLKDKEHAVRLNGILSLGFIGPAAIKALPSVVNLLGDKDWKDPVSQIHVTRTIGQIGIADPDIAVPILLELLIGQQVRNTAIIALGDVGTGAKSSIPALAKCLKDEDLQNRFNAAKSIRKISPETTADVVPVLAKLLEHETFWVRRDAAIDLGDIGPEAKSVVPALTKLLDDPSVKNEAANALKKIAGEEK